MKKRHFYIILFLIAGLFCLLTEGCSAGSTPKHSDSSGSALRLQYSDYFAAYDYLLAASPNASRKQQLELLGRHGYCAADEMNEMNTTKWESADRFFRSGTTDENTFLVMYVLTESDYLVQYRFSRKDTLLAVEMITLRDKDSSDEALNIEHYDSGVWNYTEDGWLFFEKPQPKGYDGPDGYHAVKITPIADEYREAARKYLEPIGYYNHSVFTTDWTVTNPESLNFTDIFTCLYTHETGETPECAGYTDRIPKELFEHTILNHFEVGIDYLERHAGYQKKAGYYPYRIRIAEEAFTVLVPIPQVTHIEQYGDILKLSVKAVWSAKGTDCAFEHVLTVRQISKERFVYVGNEVVPNAQNEFPVYNRLY